MRMKFICWRHFHLQVPDDWEMLLYSRAERAGRCTFADRYQYRLELSWSVFPGPPDTERMISDYATALSNDTRVATVKRTRIGAWEGLVVGSETGTSSRFGQYFPGEKCLVELVFPWPHTREQALERAIIATVGEDGADAEGAYRWRAFGMELRVPGDLALHKATIEPGHARMDFRHARDTGRVEKFERMGMVAHWLHGPLDVWLRRRVPPAVKIRETRTETIDQHLVSTITGDQPPKHLSRLLGKRRRYQARAWICPTDGRLYCTTSNGAPMAEEATAPSRRLVCCDAFRP
jgi:hypothetical protein